MYINRNENLDGLDGFNLKKSLSKAVKSVKRVGAQIDKRVTRPLVVAPVKKAVKSAVRLEQQVVKRVIKPVANRVIVPVAKLPVKAVQRVGVAIGTKAPTKYAPPPKYTTRPAPKPAKSTGTTLPNIPQVGSPAKITSDVVAMMSTGLETPQLRPVSDMSAQNVNMPPSYFPASGEPVNYSTFDKMSAPSETSGAGINTNLILALGVVGGALYYFSHRKGR